MYPTFFPTHSQHAGSTHTFTGSVPQTTGRGSPTSNIISDTDTPLTRKDVGKQYWKIAVKMEGTFSILQARKEKGHFNVWYCVIMCKIKGEMEVTR